jgi:hypothetical protein
VPEYRTGRRRVVRESKIPSHLHVCAVDSKLRNKKTTETELPWQDLPVPNPALEEKNETRGEKTGARGRQAGSSEQNLDLKTDRPPSQQRDTSRRRLLTINREKNTLQLCQPKQKHLDLGKIREENRTATQKQSDFSIEIEQNSHET